MLIWGTTIVLLLIAVFGWLFLRRDPDRYIHEQKSPINIFFRWGRGWHHFFKIAIIALFMTAIFSLYKRLLSASDVFSISASVIAGIILSGGKELLDKQITLDDIAASILGIIVGFSVVIFIF